MICNLPDLEIWMVENGFMEPHADITQAILDHHTTHEAAMQALEVAREELKDATKWITAYATADGNRNFVQKCDRYGGYLDSIEQIDSILGGE